MADLKNKIVLISGGARGIGAAISAAMAEAGAKVVNRLCGSSMDAAHQISQAIDSNDIECGIAGGTEDMFGVPMGGYMPSFNPVLFEEEYYIGMGETAENLAKELDISREDQEEFSINSHNKALKATSDGKFNNEIHPVEFNENTVSQDEGPRTPDVDKMKSLKTPIHTICEGRCYSMAALILSSGEPGNRTITPNSTVMIHSSQIPVGTEYIDPRSLNELIRRSSLKQSIIIKILVETTKQSKNKIVSTLKDDTYYSSRKAVDFGLVDKIKS